VAAITEGELLAVWEAGLGRSTAVRGLALAGAACRRDPAELADLPLGRRDALLLDLRESCFGARLSSEATCPACGQRLELVLDVGELRVDGGAEVDDTFAVEAGGATVSVRPPTSDDLLALGRGDANARRRLIERCVYGTRDTPLGEAVLDAVAARLAELDPQADVVLALSCWSCGHEWQAPFDVAGYLWIEVDAYIRRLLYDVHSLASAYGWTEAEILAVSPVRRRFYLDEVSE
jgi:hypothetical protein